MVVDLNDSLQADFERQFLQFLESVERSQTISDKQKQWLVAETQNCKSLSGVWQASDFIAKTCIAKPELLYELLRGEAFTTGKTPAQIRDVVREHASDADSEARLHQNLRIVRQKIMITLGWRDLAAAAEVEETMLCVSALADECLSQALHRHSQWLTEKLGEPIDRASNTPSKLVVLGLGKLGGNELNYSSDIDLIFSYSGAGSTTATANKDGLDNQEFFTRLGRKIIAALESVTEDGFVFRTDLRLRPNGDSGPLVLSFAAMEHYYQTHGRSWERYALIKARVVAGDTGQGDELLATLRPFVYRKYLDFGAFDSIREMKSMIERELKQTATQRDIKLGWGGIREVEFLIQSHQLIRGGRDKNLQTQALYSAMQALADCGVLDHGKVTELKAAYRFLRNVEHRLQMFADRQTQLLPADELSQFRLAKNMEFGSWREFCTQLDHHRETVHRQFRTILQDSSGFEGKSQALETRTGVNSPEFSSLEALLDIWSGKSISESHSILLNQTGFTDSDATLKLLEGFRQGRLYPSFSNIERDRLDRLMPRAMLQAGSHAEPQRALAAFISIIESIGRRTAYLSLLIENPIALNQLLHLCAASPWISRHIGQHPVVLDELLHPLIDIRQHNRDDLETELEQRLLQLDEGDEEGGLNTLREFQHAQVLRIAAADVSGVLEVEDVHLALTVLAELLLQRVFDEAVRYTRLKRGALQCEAGIIAYGKFASGDLGYHSDLDLVICFDSDTTDISDSDAEYFFSHVGRRLIHLLTVRTHAGQLYELDMRLRPSGRSGTLVTSLNGFFDYQRKQAWTWEHQALVRARPVVGSGRFIRSFEASRSQIIGLARERDELASEIKQMRRKMIDANGQSTDKVYDIKLGEGGIVDIEFLIQFWVLLWAHRYPDIALPRNTAESIAGLVENEVISADVGQNLSACYRVYLRRSLDLKLMDQAVLIDQYELLDERKQIQAIWQQTFG